MKKAGPAVAHRRKIISIAFERPSPTLAGKLEKERLQKTQYARSSARS